MIINLEIAKPVYDTFFKQLALKDARHKFPFLPADQIKQLAEMQYSAQMYSYKSQWPNAKTYLVNVDNKPTGNKNQNTKDQ